MLKAYLCARSDKPEPEIFMGFLPPANEVGISVGSLGIVLHCRSLIYSCVTLGKLLNSQASFSLSGKCE